MVIKGPEIANAIMRAFNEGHDCGKSGILDGDAWGGSKSRSEFNKWCDGPDYTVVAHQPVGMTKCEVCGNRVLTDASKQL